MTRYNPIPSPLADIELTRLRHSIVLRLSTATDIFSVIMSPAEAAVLRQELTDYSNAIEP